MYFPPEFAMPFDNLTPKMARIVLGLWLLIAVVGACVYWHGGAFPDRTIAGGVDPADVDKNDTMFYRQVVASVRAGNNYYDVVRENIPTYYLRYGSVFNWRLPTYAYVLAALGSDAVIRGVLIALICLGLWLNFRSELPDINVVPAMAEILLLFITLSWVFDSPIYSQELWSAILLTLSLGAWGNKTRWLAVLAGWGALAFRELMLPYLVVAMGVCWFAGRRREALAWLLGIVLFFAYLAWHRGQVQLQLAQMPPSPTGPGIGQWLQWGGVDFVLLTGRLSNVFTYAFPGGVIFVLLWLALLGLATFSGDRGTLIFSTTLLFLASFLVVGERNNLYWGLLYAPMIPFGWVRGVQAISNLIHRAGTASQ
jgi:hypothetical protein